jgi:hypothetical protein
VALVSEGLTLYRWYFVLLLLFALQIDTQGNMFNIYQDVDGARRVTPVGNVSDLRRFKVNEIAGVKFDRELTVVALEDGSSIPLPPGAGSYDDKGNVSMAGWGWGWVWWEEGGQLECIQNAVACYQRCAGAGGLWEGHLKLGWLTDMDEYDERSRAGDGLESLLLANGRGGAC